MAAREGSDVRLRGHMPEEEPLLAEGRGGAGVRGKGQGKGRGKGKGRGDVDAYAALPLRPGDVVTLSRFDGSEGACSVGPLVALGRMPRYRNGVVGLALLAEPRRLLRILGDGRADLDGKVGGYWTRLRGAGFRAGAGAGEAGELALYGVGSGLWFVIRRNGALGSRAPRLLLGCRWAAPDEAAVPAEVLDQMQSGAAEAADSPDEAPDETEEVAEADASEPAPAETGAPGGEDGAGEGAGPDASPAHAQGYWTVELQNPPVFELGHPPLHPLDAYLSEDVFAARHAVEDLDSVSEGQVLAAWSSLLCRYGRAEDLMVYVERAGGPLVLRLPFSGEWPLPQLADTVAQKIRGAEAHAAELEAHFAKAGDAQPLCQVGFAFGAGVVAERSQEALRECMECRLPGMAAARRQLLQLRASPRENGSLELQLLHLLGICSSASAARMLAHLEALLRTEGPCGAVELCTPRERELVLRWSDATSEEYEEHASEYIHEAFEAYAQKAPQRLALVEDERSMTYEELAAAAAHVASRLRSVGVQPDALVPLMSPRSLEMIIGIFGILMAEGAYVPLDTKWPDDRICEVAAQCAPRAVCAGPGCRDRVAALAGAVVELDARAPAGAGAPAPARRGPGGQGAVYCFFTSGSTGKPKGVVVEHRGLVHRIRWFQSRWGMREGERGVLKHSYTFGLSEWEIFWPLSTGGTVVLCRPDGEKDMEYLWGLTDRHQIRTQVFVPSVLRALLEHGEMEVQDSRRLWPKLRAAITCGEALSTDLANLFSDLVPHATLDNLYGPTEGEMTVWRCPKGEILRGIPIGVPIGGSRVLLLAAGALAGIGEPGEIHFGGQFIARGYLGDAALTTQKFIEDQHEGGRGKRLYASGDLARWRESGIMDFLGRADFQVKLRGFRIELGEIEEALRAGGAASAVCVLAGEAPQQRLVAYVVLKGGDVGAVRASCARRLPHYMVPAVIMPLAELPRTASGKPDRRALPPPPASTEDTADGGPFIAPRSEVEEQIRGVWAAVLGVPPEGLSVEADWLLVGGNSLLAGRATAMLRKELGVQLPGTAMYTHSSIMRLAELAQKLGAESGKGSGGKDQQEAAASSKVVPAEDRYHGLSASRPFALLAGLCVAATACGVSDTSSTALRCVLGWYVYAHFGRTALICALPLVIAASLVIEAALCVVLKTLVIGRLSEGRYPLWGVDYYRWLLSRHLVEKVRDRVAEMVSGTEVFSAFYRALGASIGQRVDLNDPELEEPELVSLGDDVEVNHARFGTAAILDGELVLGRIGIASRCRICPRAMLVMGTDLKEGSEVGPLATSVGRAGPVGAVCPPAASGIDRVHTQSALRLAAGLPLLLLLHSLPYVPLVHAVEGLWALTSSRRWLFWLLAPAVCKHCYALGFFALVVLQKRLLVGRLLPGPVPEEGTWAWQWDAFRTWLHEQAVSARAFDDAVDPFVGSEVLSAMYRLLGVRVGRRVQIDNFHSAEHDCIAIGDDAVMGSVISIFCGGRRGREEVRLHRGANVLDHGCLMPGTRVGERAILGSATLGPEGSYFPPESVSTGQLGGRPVRLRFQTSTEEQRGTELEALRRLNSARWFWGFNGLLAVAGLACGPLPFYVAAAAYRCAAWSWMALGALPTLALLPWAFLGINLAVLLANWVLKCCIIGRYTEGDYPFFGSYHIRWMVMLILAGTMEEAVDALQGTELLCWYFRAMGARVGKNCCIFGLAFEYDLLSVGDCCSIGWECDTTCHTVENMVIKLSPTQLDSYSSLLPHSMVSPGASVGCGAVLLENSQVLKGEMVPPNECWAGLPATSHGTVSDLLAVEESKDAEPIEEVEPLEAEIPEALDNAVSVVEVRSEAVADTPSPDATAKLGLAALEEYAIVTFPDAAGSPQFMVEWLENGSLCLWSLSTASDQSDAPAEGQRRLGGHLRLRMSREVDFGGGRGFFAQFSVGAVGGSQGVVLRGVGTGLCVGIGDEGRLHGCAEAQALRVEQLSGPNCVALPKALRRQRLLEEARGRVQERRQEAAYALQAAAQWGGARPKAAAKAKGKGKGKAKAKGKGKGSDQDRAAE